MIMDIHFRSYCETLQKIRETRGNNAKARIFAEYIKQIDSDEELKLAAQFIGEGAFSDLSGKRASVGSRTSAVAAAAFCKIDYDLVFKPCRTATGSSSETISRLMENIPAAIEKRSPREISLIEIQEIFDRLHKARSRVDKEQILWETWGIMTPIEIKFFIRMLSRGSLRIGFETKSVTSSIAKAFDREPEAVRYAQMITGSLGKTALLARENRLNEATFRLFHPLAFMLASPIESRKVENLHEYIAEEKFDGMRAQVHINKNQVKLFSRDLNDITASFPDIVEFFHQKNLPPTVLDGEICLFKKNTIQPFQLLQKRMGVKKPSKKMLREFPVLFIPFDILYSDGEPVFHLTLDERRALLENLTADYHLPITNQFEINHPDDIETMFLRALEHGNEGLMLKHWQSVYEYGQRRKSWLKVKQPGGSFETVMMYAHAGSGRRGGTYSDFTLGISVKDDERYEEEFIPIGKAYGGYSDSELKELNLRIKELTVERYGPTLGLKPGIIVELEFDDIQVNKRTKAGYTLRFPRFRSIRKDLSLSDVNTLKDVEKQYQEKLDQQRLSQTVHPSFIFDRDESNGA
tara:strand:+ start:516 stop:2249 length:1734 start_codon:yes stop_codon:yes gene_type:complete